MLNYSVNCTRQTTGYPTVQRDHASISRNRSKRSRSFFLRFMVSTSTRTAISLSVLVRFLEKVLYCFLLSPGICETFSRLSTTFARRMSIISPAFFQGSFKKNTSVGKWLFCGTQITSRISVPSLLSSLSGASTFPEPPPFYEFLSNHRL